MLFTRVLRSRTPLIHFIGKRSVPASIDHTPRAHPASPTHELPTSFKQYRETVATMHGPLNSASAQFSPQPKRGEYFDRSELPARFRRMAFSPLEMECIESGGAAQVDFR